MQPVDRALAAELVAAWETCDETAAIDRAVGGPTTRTGDGREVPLRAGVSPRYGRLLYTLVRRLRPRRVLEVGMACGVSSAYLAAALRANEARGDAHVVIDPHQSTEWQDAGRALLARLGLSEARVIEEVSLKAIPRLEDEGERFDLVFLDGNHRLDYVLADVLAADRVLERHGLLVLDDAIDFGVALAVRYLDRHRPNLRRVPLDGRLAHWARERLGRGRRLAIYQKVDDDRRGPDGV